jgi:hypothetical protein
MRWFGLGKRRVEHDPARQQNLAQEVRRQYGGHVRARFPDQATAAARLMDGDDGLIVAAGLLQEFAEAARAELLAQTAELHRRTGHGLVVDRRNYRPLWQEAGPYLRWSLFELPGGPHPYIQVAAAATVVAEQARRAVRVIDPDPLLTHLMETLDLILVGWEYGRVQVDVDAAALATQLVTAAREIRSAMPEPPPLPPAVRELMRRNHTVDVYDPTGSRIVGGFNPGRTMREQLLA